MTEKDRCAAGRGNDSRMADSDALIVERTLRGDGEAYGVLVERYQSAVLAQALAVTGRLADAEDIAQEAFLKAYRALPGLKRPSAFARWLFGITRNTCHDWLRDRQRREAAGLAERGAGRVADPVDPGAALPAEEAARRQATPARPVGINSAGLAELESLPGIGHELAMRILYYRHEHGPFRSYEDLTEVPGIGAQKVAELRACTTLN